MKKFHIVVISLLSVMVCVLVVMVFVLMNGQSSSSVVEEVVVAPAAPAVAVDGGAGKLAGRAEAPAVPVVEPSPDAFVVPESVDPVRMQALQRKLEALALQESPDFDEADALFEELIDVQGSHMIGGLDLNVMRQALRVARDLQEAGNELAAEKNKPEPDAAKVKTLEEKVAVLQNRLQAIYRGQAQNMRRVGPLPRAGRP
ncbi:MAG: hypothetical protein LBJ46_02150 [Planctomycetota bacterium]|jgi:hypothetical protein|nr:hypothetical protein [Planctomycetota bacterium]